jgi:hypothetical protein
MVETSSSPAPCFDPPQPSKPRTIHALASSSPAEQVNTYEERLTSSAVPIFMMRRLAPLLPLLLFTPSPHAKRADTPSDAEWTAFAAAVPARAWKTDGLGRSMRALVSMPVGHTSLTSFVTRCGLCNLRYCIGSTAHQQPSNDRHGSPFMFFRYLRIALCLAYKYVCLVAVLLRSGPSSYFGAVAPLALRFVQADTLAISPSLTSC